VPDYDVLHIELSHVDPHRSPTAAQSKATVSEFRFHRGLHDHCHTLSGGNDSVPCFQDHSRRIAYLFPIRPQIIDRDRYRARTFDGLNNLLRRVRNRHGGRHGCVNATHKQERGGEEP
jgi:hypothetical protein